MAATGYACGLRRRRHRFGMVVLPILIAAVMLLVVDLDHPRSGLVQAGQGPMLRLHQSLNARHPGGPARSSRPGACAGDGAELPVEVRLVEVAGVQRQPGQRRARAVAVDGVAQPQQGGQLLGRGAHHPAEALLERILADAQPAGERPDLHRPPGVVQGAHGGGHQGIDRLRSQPRRRNASRVATRSAIARGLLDASTASRPPGRRGSRSSSATVAPNSSCSGWAKNGAAPPG